MRRRTGSVVCPRCERLVGINEQKCPHCGAWQPGMFGYGPAIQRALGGQFDLTNGITVFCGVLYLFSLAMDPRAILQMAGLFDLLSPSSLALYRLGMTGGVAWDQGWWWTVCTATFLHGSLLHILFNMAIMRQYMPNLVHLYGTPRAFVIFMAGGVGGYLLSNFGTPLFFHGQSVPTIGASGAIFGLFGALIAYGRRTHQTYVTQQLWTLAIVMFVIGLLPMGGMGRVNNWAHAGGFIAGFIASELMPDARRREGMGLLLLAGALVLVTFAGFVLSFVGVGALLQAAPR